MFRPIALLSKTRALPIKRFYCKPKEKCFVIKTNDKDGKVKLYDSQIVQKFREHVEREKQLQSSWKRLVETVRRLMMNGQQKSVELIKTWELKEKMLEMKKSQVEKLSSKISSIKENIKLNEIPERARSQLEVIKASDGLKKVASIPKEVQRYWGVFLQSELRTRLEEVIVWMWIVGKNATLKIFKFIREAYFDQPKESPK